MYVIIDNKEQATVIKFLSKVEDFAGVNNKTLSKHFNRHSKPYKKGKYTIYKCRNYDLKSYNRGNKDNFNGNVDNSYY